MWSLSKKLNIASKPRHDPEDDRYVEQAKDQSGRSTPPEPLTKLMELQPQPLRDAAVLSGPDRQPYISQDLREKQDRRLVLQSRR